MPVLSCRANIDVTFLLRQRLQQDNILHLWLKKKKKKKKKKKSNKSGKQLKSKRVSSHFSVHEHIKLWKLFFSDQPQNDVCVCVCVSVTRS